MSISYAQEEGKGFQGKDHTVISRLGADDCGSLSQGRPVSFGVHGPQSEGPGVGDLVQW